MPPSCLSELQTRVLALLADVQPPWTLTGGGALAGMHLGHRVTRDLDLFWRGATVLGLATDAVVQRLRGAGLRVDSLQTSPAFQQLRVADGADTIVVDLVADPVPTIEPPVAVRLGEQLIHIDSMHEILVNKLCALLGRSELRDLIDIRALLDRGLDLDRALRDAPRKDVGFSPLTLAWVLKQQSLRAAATTAGVDAEALAALTSFRDVLLDRLVKAAKPDESPAR